MNEMILADVTYKASLMSEEKNTDLITAYAELAHDKIMAHLYPFGGKDDLPERYTSVWVDATVYLINKRGAEHETTHTENGITRIYESADLPNGILRKLVPQCGVL